MTTTVIPNGFHQVFLLRETPLLLPSPTPKLPLPAPHMFETPNTRVSRQLDAAYAFYNKALFDGKLANAYFHLHRKRNALGYFWEQRGSGITVDGKGVHEIALDPDKLNRSRPIVDILSTIVHEMVHFWQRDHGEQHTNVAHNKEWADKMESLGLMPSSTGAPGGKRTGRRVTHYVISGGRFERATRELLATGYKLTVSGTPKCKPLTKPYRTTFRCPSCRDTVLAKPTVQLACRKCSVAFENKYPR